ncbi:MAG: hypothetical protein CME65_15910 [Halobacteriovoraceae bacterium]|nr:hypothetical protein [Halobacteriovoraceae bacterium]|tara:strand:+ start:22333 stop:22836 length:504 start_codon:yes stop_codon:yes gene_type:complete
MKLIRIFEAALLVMFLVSCASKPKPEVDALGLRLASDGFSTISFNVIKVTTGDKVEYIVNGVLDYEAPGPLKIKLDKDKPMFVAIQDEVENLIPIEGKYKYIPKKVSEGTRILHIQSHEYKVTKEVLERMSVARRVVVRIPASPHKDGGFDGVMRTAQKNLLIDFID